MSVAELRNSLSGATHAEREVSYELLWWSIPVLLSVLPLHALVQLLGAAVTEHKVPCCGAFVVKSGLVRRGSVPFPLTLLPRLADSGDGLEGIAGCHIVHGSCDGAWHSAAVVKVWSDPCYVAVVAVVGVCVARARVCVWSWLDLHTGAFVAASVLDGCSVASPSRLHLRNGPSALCQSSPVHSKWWGCFALVCAHLGLVVLFLAWLQTPTPLIAGVVKLHQHTDLDPGTVIVNLDTQAVRLYRRMAFGFGTGGDLWQLLSPVSCFRWSCLSRWSILRFNCPA